MPATTTLYKGTSPQYMFATKLLPGSEIQSLWVTQSLSAPTIPRTCIALHTIQKDLYTTISLYNKSSTALWNSVATGHKFSWCPYKSRANRFFIYIHTASHLYIENLFQKNLIRKALYNETLTVLWNPVAMGHQFPWCPYNPADSYDYFIRIYGLTYV